MVDPAEAVFAVVRQIRPGSVATYGQVADLVDGVSVSAREVGAIMHVSPPDVPWQRVVGASGRLPIGKKDPLLKMRQRELLEAEGVAFLPNDCIDMSRHQLHSDEGALPGLLD
jgi:methylated-DNA-protein-cysteine methyltransferase related protein